ncbi:antibiotic biosynthesis monooxygenase [Streptomyces sp. NPDC057702]|uniref:antibiotic biosynthesis monooxygenase n=1 Tax=unclassified Streptomyces TaxID=2593676 RepID=UPI0036B9642B
MTSPATTPPLPDVTRPDAGTILVSPWLVSDPAFQRAAADSLVDSWEAMERPDAMLTLTTLLSTDGGRVLNYAQWTNDEDHHAFVRTRRPALVRAIDDALPGIERPGLTRYRLYDSYRAPADVPAPGAGTPTGPAARAVVEAVVTGEFETDGPTEQRRLADLVIAGLRESPVPDLVAAHFHLSLDGLRVLNYAEWASHDGWRSFAGSGTAQALADAVNALPGIRPLGPTPYDPYRAVVNVPAP